MIYTRMGTRVTVQSFNADTGIATVENEYGDIREYGVWDLRADEGITEIQVNLDNDRKEQ